ncbi:hypothetical protein BD626DRAFT_486623 [Schizophyllum amplum]|uniref:Uncharacterized protein n=1 Tax=Schizophyllum amplum TaxID=97359 RepID=A0A550CMR9_9AGAR|nr:hypothetical protein BD626DRAFT_486623 [Auriculariopsis ampla]
MAFAVNIVAIRSGGAQPMYAPACGLQGKYNERPHREPLVHEHARRLYDTIFCMVRPYGLQCRPHTLMSSSATYFQTLVYHVAVVSGGDSDTCKQQRQSGPLQSRLPPPPLAAVHDGAISVRLAYALAAGPSAAPRRHCSQCVLWRPSDQPWPD